MDALVNPIRWVHVLAAAAWLGEVVVINFVLIPALGRFDLSTRRRFLTNVFPRIFRLASVLSATTVAAGLFLVLHRTGGDPALLTESRWGVGILIGGSMGILLTLFHFFMENRLAKRIGVGCMEEPSDADLEDVHTKLKIVPRVGLAVITTIALLMMYAARGA